MSADGQGNVYLSGYTGGSLGRPNAGSFDAFVAKIVAPEPSMFVMVVLPLAGMGLVGPRLRG